MRLLLIFIVCICCSSPALAQGDLPDQRSIETLPENPDTGVSPNANTNSGLRIPASLDRAAGFEIEKKRNEVKMLPDRELKQAGHDLVLSPNIEAPGKGKGSEHYGDMYLGDFKTTAKFVGIVCRDHEFVDGDRVRIYVNGRVAEHNILLTGAYKGINVELDRGFNRLEFEALNQGSTGPNTAQIDVYDEKGQLLYSNKWLLSTGSKASLIIVKEGEN
ncbi:hypothetical protein SAMN04490243_1431 [Robiginitalea myxolifaciens]|uniref:Secreted protein n=1 Tax=Robiginitalea myxolifaciens TaxID=400055 RepID=A0A1I6G9I8_9FLAO|nr:hypothetical protein [Robiginitalea myxolifaciens]SFR38737.1 hypothetical protein SAMN04490243_1431 [Robiginitalea myxolifaciens]